MVTHGQAMAERHLSLGKIVLCGGSGSRVMGLMSLQVPCGRVLLAGI